MPGQTPDCPRQNEGLVVDDDSFRDIVNARIQELGTNINRAEAQHGLPQFYMRGALRTDAKAGSPTLTKVVTICGALGLRVTITSVEPRDCPWDAPFVHVETPEIPALPVAGTRARWRSSPAPPIAAWRGLLAWLRRSAGTWWGESIGAVCAVFLFLMILIAGGILQ